MGYSNDQIEDAICAALTAAPELSYVKKKFVLHSTDAAETLKNLKQWPAVGVAGTSGEFAGDMTGITDETGLFAVVALNRNLRSKTAALRGEAPGEKGCWDIIADCRKVLQHSRLGLDIFDCLCRRRHLLFATTSGAACVLEVEVSWRHSDSF